MDAAKIGQMIHPDIGRLRREDDLHRLIGDHHPRHSRRKAEDLWISAQVARVKLRQIGFENRLIFGGQRGLLLEAARLARVPLRARIGPAPLPIEVRILALVERLSAGRAQQRCCEHDGTNRASVKHGLPFPEFVTPRCPWVWRFFDKSTPAWPASQRSGPLFVTGERRRMLVVQ